MATLVASCCQKTNQLESVRGMKNKEPIKIFVSQKKKKVLPWQHLLPGIAEKLISRSLCRGMENKEPIKIFTSSRNQKSVGMATLVARFAEKLIRPSRCRGMESKEHGNTYCQILPRKQSHTNSHAIKLSHQI